MSDIVFDILQIGDEANGFEWHIEVSGPSALYVGDTFCINAETFSAIQISLVTELNVNLYCGEQQFFPLIPMIPPGTSDTPVSPGLCCEIRNSTGHAVNAIELLGSGFTLIDSVPSLANGSSIWFFTEDPIEDTQISSTPCCVAPSTLVATPTGPMPISQLRPGDNVLDFRGMVIPVLKVIRFRVPRYDFVRIGELMICNDHPVLDSNLQERPCQSLPEATVVQLDQPIFVYTLVTQEKSFVLMQDRAVATWASDTWSALSPNMARFSELPGRN